MRTELLSTSGSHLSSQWFLRFLLLYSVWLLQRPCVATHFCCDFFKSPMPSHIIYHVYIPPYFIRSLFWGGENVSTLITEK